MYHECKTCGVKVKEKHRRQCDKCRRPKRERKGYAREAERRYYATQKGQWSRWNRSLIDKYGITGEEYAWMEHQQNRVCRGCNREATDRSLCVDHCHETGRVRGLLCDACNLTLGKTEDSPETLRRLASYLEEAHGV